MNARSRLVLRLKCVVDPTPWNLGGDLTMFSGAHHRTIVILVVSKTSTKMSFGHRSPALGMNRRGPQAFVGPVQKGDDPIRSS